jgi:hypothetical protein
MGISLLRVPHCAFSEAIVATGLFWVKKADKKRQITHK